MNAQLDDLRKQIDSIDNQMINLLAKRFIIVKKIGIWKKQKDMAPLDKKRWMQVLKNRIMKGKTLHINPKFIKKIFEAIHNEALIIEQQVEA